MPRYITDTITGWDGKTISFRLVIQRHLFSSSRSNNCILLLTDVKSGNTSPLFVSLLTNSWWQHSTAHNRTSLPSEVHISVKKCIHRISFRLVRCCHMARIDQSNSKALKMCENAPLQRHSGGRGQREGMIVRDFVERNDKISKIILTLLLQEF